MLPRDKVPDGGLADTLDDIFGDAGWRNLYHEPECMQMNLLGEVEMSPTRTQGIDGLLSYYSKRLRTLFNGVLEPARLTTHNNAPLFALYSLVANDSDRARALSQRIAKALLRKIGK